MTTLQGNILNSKFKVRIAVCLFEICFFQCRSEPVLFHWPDLIESYLAVPFRRPLAKKTGQTGSDRA